MEPMEWKEGSRRDTTLVRASINIGRALSVIVPIPAVGVAVCTALADNVLHRVLAEARINVPAILGGYERHPDVVARGVGH